MLACRFKALLFATHSHRPIVDFRHVQLVLCFVLNLLGAMITQMAPPIPHSKTLDKFLCPTPSTVHWLLFFFTSNENLRCPHFVATCGPASKPNCRGCGPKTPRHYAPPAVIVLSHSFWRLFDCFGVSLVPAGFLTQYIQQQRTDRSHRQVGKRTVTQTHTLQHYAAHTQARFSQTA